MMVFFRKLQVYLFPLIIISFCVFLSFKNYQPNTFLVGWDSIHSELNIKESLYRAFWGVWREDQSLGTLAIHSHMADLPRIITIWVLSLVLPQNLLRYSYICLTLILGPLGVYFLLNYILNKYKFITSVASFLGAIFYLLNLGTLQHFFVPFEMFNAGYAFIPWLYLLIIKYLKEGNKKDLLLFGFFNILASPMAYAATLFYAYLGGLLMFIFIFNLFEHKRVIFKRTFIVIFITILLNLYWILPNIYSIASASSNVSKAKINVLFSPEAFIRNEDYGDLKNVIINKSFLFDWRAYNFETNQFDDLLSRWNSHLSSTGVLNTTYIISIIALIGLLLSVLKFDKIGISFFGVGLFSLFFLFNFNGPTGSLYSYIYNNFEIFREGLRTPFTKFSIPFMLVMSYFFGYFFNFCLNISRNKNINRILSIIFLVSVSFSLIYVMKPAFEGNLISWVVKKDIPNEYFEIFTWFDSHKFGRVAQLPLNTPWGWDYNSWGYQGSNFLGFGINNPIIIRDYDRWSPFNETFYLQASNALYDSQQNEFKKILEKYQVKYLLLDESIIDAGGDKNILRIPEIKKTLYDLGFPVVFNSGFLTVYDTNIATNNSVKVLNNYSLVNSDLDYSLVDPIYSKYGDYVQNEDGIGYPFVNFDKRGLVNIKIINNELLITNKSTNSEVQLPIDGKTSETFASDRGFNEAFNCDLMKKGGVFRKQLEIGRSYKATGGGVSCDYFSYTNLTYDKAYVLRVKGNNLDGRSLKIYLYNWETKRVELEELMPTDKFDEYFVIYPKDSKEGGYTLNIETRSFGRISSENEINLIEIVPFDINLVSNLYIDPRVNISKTGNLEIKDIKKYGTSIYKVLVKGEGLLVLNQSFEKGWISYPKLEHVKVNSWANGFVINNNSINQVKSGEIIIYFWPQLLEWGGILVLLLTSIGLIVKLRE
jgi:hypothetical protein